MHIPMFAINVGLVLYIRTPYERLDYRVTRSLKVWTLVAHRA